MNFGLIEYFRMAVYMACPFLPIPLLLQLIEVYHSNTTRTSQLADSSSQGSHEHLPVTNFEEN